MDKATRVENLVWLGVQWLFLVRPCSFPIYKYPLVEGLSNLLGEETRGNCSRDDPSPSPGLELISPERVLK